METYCDFIKSLIADNHSALSRRDIITVLIDREIQTDEFAELVTWICRSYPEVFTSDFVTDRQLGTSLPAYPDIKNDDPLRPYISDVIRYAAQDPDELKGVSRKETAEQLVKKLLFVTVAEAKDYMDNPYVPLISLIEFGNRGLIKAVEEYHLSSETELISYVKWWIHYYIQSGINNICRETFWYALNEPEEIRNYRNVIRIQKELRGQLKMEPDREEINRELKRLGLPGIKTE